MATAQFSVDPGALSFNLNVFHNLLIGNVPLRSSFAHFQPRIVGHTHTTQTQSDSLSNVANSGDAIASLIANDYPDLRKYNNNLVFPDVPLL